MSLNFDLREIPEDVRTIVAEEDQPISGIKKGDRIMSPVTNALIWSTLGVGIGEINDDTAEEFYARLHLWELVNGAMLQTWPEDSDQPQPRFITKDEVMAHKGLSTNVFPMEKRKAWIARTIPASSLFLGVPEPKYPRR